MKERVAGRLGMKAWLEGFDLVWDTRSGDSFSDIYGSHRHSVMSTVHEFAAQTGRPVVMAPQTIGPFRSVSGRMLGRRSLHRSALVFARDPVSAAAAAALGRPVDAVTSDLAFAIAPPEPVAERRDVILNVSGLLWQENPHVDARAYRETVTAIVRMLLSDPARSHCCRTSSTPTIATTTHPPSTHSARSSAATSRSWHPTASTTPGRSSRARGS